MGCSTFDTPGPRVRVIRMPSRRHFNEGALLRLGGPGWHGATRAPGPRNATHYLYHRDQRLRDELRDGTWTHQQSPVKRVTKTPDHPIVQAHRVSAANRAGHPVVQPGDLPKIPGASAAMSSATRAGETEWSACTAPVLSNFSPKAFLSRPTPGPPLFPRPSWRSTRIGSCSAPSVTTDRTSGPMANSLAMDRPCRPRRARPRSDSGRSGVQ
jgi:hypothetical protein